MKVPGVSTRSKCEVSMPDEGAADDWEEPTFCFKPELVSDTKRRQWLSPQLLIYLWLYPSLFYAQV